MLPCDISGIVDVFTCCYQATHVPSRDHCIAIAIHATNYIYSSPPHMPSILSVHAYVCVRARACVCVWRGLCVTVLWHTWQYYLYFCKLMIWGYKKWSLFRNWFLCWVLLLGYFFFLKEKVSIWCHHILPFSTFEPVVQFSRNLIRMLCHYRPSQCRNS
jgi:hypothetical protein